MSKEIEITINGLNVRATEREPLIDVCEREGIHIPTMCHHPRLEPYGACRVCLAKATWGTKSKYVTACNYPVEEGDIFDTESDDVKGLRSLTIEALLGRCPNEPGVIEFARKYGISHSRLAALEPGGDDCILCGLCVRVCDEVVGSLALGFKGRGNTREVGTPFIDSMEACIACGACSSVCPTTAMKMEGARTKAMLMNHGDIRMCRYTLMGYFPGGICANNYRCRSCDIDQKYRDLSECEHPIFTARPDNRKGGEAA
jgi:NADH dehydrogenase/NADH:ubiquinone oxidoreductase subunit G